MKINPHNYKNIIFDLGGVLLNIDYQLTIKAFQSLGLSHFDTLFSQAKQQHFFDKYETGQITTQEFRTYINDLYENKLSQEQINIAWNALLLDFPPERFGILSKVKNTHRTFLLSNTNELHIAAFTDYLKTHLQVNNFFDYFEKAYLSYEIGIRKPSKEAFLLVLNENNLKPEETLFIDDSIQHVESAKTLGIQTYWLDINKESILNLFT